MSEFLNSVKADLLDRRLLPFVALVGVALIAAIAYAVLGGGSSSSPSAAAIANSSPVPATTGISVTGATEEKSVAETTDGVSEQRSGHARNPFEAIVKSTPTTASTTTAPASTGSSSSGSSSATSTKTETSTSKTPAKKKTETVYHVAIEFGLFPAGSTPETVVLTPYENLKLKTPLPSATQPLIVYRGVTSGGKSATFSIVGEAILHGIGNCLPSASQCEALDLKPGQSEQLEYLPPGGETIVYELRVVSISSSKASVASAGALAESRAGREILRRAGLLELPFLRPSSQPGVLLWRSQPAKSARAHTAIVASPFSH